MKWKHVAILGLIGLIAVGAVIYAVYFFTENRETGQRTYPTPERDETPIEPQPEPATTTAVLGQSVQGRDIESTTYGSGDNHVVFVGGIHGGYEWNSVLLAYEMMDYLENNPDQVPENVRVTVVPALNPDGLVEVVGTTGRFAASTTPPVEQTRSGRFNANDVDLNRNFACNWQATSTWQGREVSAGASAFSEPEAQAMRDFVMAEEPDVVLFLHSAAGAVYGSSCNDGILPETLDVMNLYADAAGYRAEPTFDAYEITGDAEGWLATLGIPSVSVELTSHEDLEWEQNRAGLEAILEYYGSTTPSQAE